MNEVYSVAGERFDGVVMSLTRTHLVSNKLWMPCHDVVIFTLDGVKRRSHPKGSRRRSKFEKNWTNTDMWGSTFAVDSRKNCFISVPYKWGIDISKVWPFLSWNFLYFSIIALMFCSINGFSSRLWISSDCFKQNFSYFLKKCYMQCL